MQIKNLLLILFITFLSSNSFSQIKFEKGYFIDNSDKKTECLIENIDWVNNPSKFNFKLNESSLISEKDMNTVKEFGVLNLKYKRFVVDIDRSSEQTSKLSNVRGPIFNNEVVFLKLLVEGNANLYFYHDVSLNRYFYSISNGEVSQLVFKTYKNDDNEIKENSYFKQQLLNDLKCSSSTKIEVEKLKYKKNDLINYFVKYNNCKHANYINYEEKTKKDLFNLAIRPGFNSSSLTIENGVSDFRNTDFNNEINFRFGIEAEFVLPFRKNKWTVLIEPTYQYFKSTKEIENQIDAVVDYKSIELQTGLRYYSFIDDSSKIFVNGLFVIDLPMDSYVRTLDISSSNNFALGIGYNYKEKYSLELRYLTNREVLNNYASWSSEYKTISIIFGYNLF